jgi:two-component system cell cycle response regulator
MKKVLTVDDSKVVRSMVSRHLQPYGCEVIEAANGQEGVEAARANRPDLILLDVTMPVMDGRQCLAEIRKDAATKAIPVIMLTAESGRELVVEIAKLGVNGYIVKPFQKDGFEKEVSKVLGPPAGPALAPVDRKAVLIVDDSDKVLEAARAALADGMTVLTALSGKDAVARYTEARPGVVVIDLAMPEMDGFQTLDSLKDLGKSGFVALAVRGDATLHEKARKAGYHGVVDKPFSARELVEQVHLASAAVASAEELLAAVVGDDGGCTVVDLPDPRSKAFAKLLPALQKKLKSLAENGSDKLIVDLGQLVEVNADVVKSLVGLVSGAGEAGFKTVLCSSSAQVADSLKQIAETRDCVYPTRQAAREALQ